MLNTIMVVTVLTFYGSGVSTLKVTERECAATKIKIERELTHRLTYEGRTQVDCIKIYTR